MKDVTSRAAASGELDNGAWSQLVSLEVGADAISGSRNGRRFTVRSWGQSRRSSVTTFW